MFPNVNRAPAGAMKAKEELKRYNPVYRPHPRRLLQKVVKEYGYATAAQTGRPVDHSP